MTSSSLRGESLRVVFWGQVLLWCRCSVSQCLLWIAAAARAACCASQWAPTPGKTLPASSFSRARSGLFRLEPAKPGRGLLPCETSLSPTCPTNSVILSSWPLGSLAGTSSQLWDLCAALVLQVRVLCFWVALPAMRHSHCTDRSPALLCSQESPVWRSRGRAGGIEHIPHPLLGRPEVL